MTRGVGGQSPANVQTYLKGIHFPATRDDLVQKARENDAPQEVLSIIEQLPEDEFGGPQDVMKAWKQIH